MTLSAKSYVKLLLKEMPWERAERYIQRLLAEAGPYEAIFWREALMHLAAESSNRGGANVR
jgi:predicted phosphoadenosine phosphosulfate sulfurtransferase